MSHQAYSILSAQLMATLIYYTHSQWQYQVQLTGLIFNKFCLPCKLITETMGPMEGITWEACMGLKLIPVVVRHLLGPLGMSVLMSGTSCMDSQLYTPNSPNGRYNLPLAAHPSPPPTPTPSCPSTSLLYVLLVILQRLRKSCLKSSSVRQLASGNTVIIHQLKDCSGCTVELQHGYNLAQESHNGFNT